MIPILSDSATLTGNGLGGLSDAIECTVFNEINGEYELRMRYPITGEHYSEMLINYFIFADPQILASPQPFRIYRITRPLNGVVTVYARHLAYDMSGIVIQPMTAASLTAALTAVPANAVPSPCPFTLASSRTVATQLKLVEPRTMWRVLGGEAGSFLDVYGGEWEFDGYTATLKTTLGTNRGVTVRYGKNLTELEQDANIETTYGGVFPYWYDDTDGLVTLTELFVPITGSPYSRILLLDCGEYFDTKPTEAQLRTQAQNYITANSVGDIKTSWKVSFALLAQSGEYETQAVLEQVQLGDTVNVVYEALGVNASARVVKTEYDVLGDKYKSVTLGRVKQNLASILVGQNRETENAIAQTKSALEIAIANSTDFIKNGTGYMRFIYNSAGDLVEIVSLDNSDISQAQSVWRWNNGGFGHSSTGYNGAYTTAITQNGAIVADFITTGTLNAQRVKTGILSDALNKNSWDLDTGVFTITDGEIYINTNNQSQDIIKFNTTNVFTAMAAGGYYSGFKYNGTEYRTFRLTSLTAGDKYNAISMYKMSNDLSTGVAWTNYDPTQISFNMWNSGLGSYKQVASLGNDALNSPGGILRIRDGVTDYDRAAVNASGLTFRNSSDVVTAQYPSTGLWTKDVPSANMVDRLTFVQGTLSSGADSASTTRLRSPFIAVEPNTTYYVGTNSPLLVYAVNYYNGSFTYQSLITINATTGTFTTPSGILFARFLVRKSDDSTITLSDMTQFYLRKNTGLTGNYSYALSNADITNGIRFMDIYSSASLSATTIVNILNANNLSIPTNRLVVINVRSSGNENRLLVHKVSNSYGGAQCIGYYSVANSYNFFMLYDGTWTEVKQIRAWSTGVSWYLGRAYAAFRSGSKPPDGNGYWPVLELPAVSGDWSIGVLGNRIRFVYITDANYSAGNNYSVAYNLPEASPTSNLSYEILTNNTGALKPTHVSGGGTMSATTSYKYSGYSFTVPADRYFSVTAQAYYSAVSPSKVCISDSSSAINSGHMQVEGTVDSQNTRARITWTAYASAQTTYYVWAQGAASGTLGIGIDGFYFS